MTDTALFMPMQRDASFGDHFVQAPIAHALKHSLGADRVIVIAPHPFSKLLYDIGVADEVHVIDDEDIDKVSACIRKEKPRWALSLRGSSLRSSWLLWRNCQKNGCSTAGWRNAGNRLLLNKTVPRVRDDYYSLVLERPLKLLGGHIDIPAMAQHIAEDDPRDALAPDLRRILCIPAGNVAAKQWGLNNYLALGRAFTEQNQNLVPTAILGPKEADFARSFQSAGWSTIITPHPRRLMALCRDAHVIIANDCGPSHLAHMSGSPLVTLFHNDGNNKKRQELIQLWWWRRPHSRAITTSTARAISEIPVALVFQEALAAINSAELLQEALWWGEA